VLSAFYFARILDLSGVVFVVLICPCQIRGSCFPDFSHRFRRWLGPPLSPNRSRVPGSLPPMDFPSAVLLPPVRFDSPLLNPAQARQSFRLPPGLAGPLDLSSRFCFHAGSALVCSRVHFSRSSPPVNRAKTAPSSFLVFPLGSVFDFSERADFWFLVLVDHAQASILLLARFPLSRSPRFSFSCRISTPKSCCPRGLRFSVVISLPLRFLGPIAARGV
jgi:hypothetical protein